jgi:hypothetical protein
MPSSIILSGSRTAIPGVYSVLKIDRSDTTELGTKNLAVVGDFKELQPLNATDYKVLINQEVKDIIPSPSETIKILENLWKKSLSTDANVFGTSSSSLTFINARQTGLTQATGNLETQNALVNIADNASIITLKSKIWGAKGNRVSFELILNNITDNDSDDIDVTIKTKYLNDSRSVKMDKGFRNVIQLKTKAAKTPQIRIQNGTLTIKDTAGTTTLVSVSLDEFGTMAELFDYLASATPNEFQWDDLGACFINYHGVLPSQLDCIGGSTADSFKTLSAAATVKITAITQGILDAINIKNPSLFVEASLTTANKRVGIVDFQAVNELLKDVGSTDGSAVDGSAATAADYEDALAACVNQDFLIITCLDDSTDVAEKLKAHLDECVSQAEWRNGWIGTTAELSLADIYATYVLPNQSPLLSVVGQGVTFEGENYSPKYTAFLMMCMQGTLPPAQPQTNLVPNISETKQAWSRDVNSSVENAISKGITVITAQGPLRKLRVARSITTYLQDNLSVNCEVSARESVNLCLKDLQKFLYNQIGSRITNATQTLVTDLTRKRLETQQLNGIIKNFANIDVVVTADTAFVSFDLAVTEPLNFIKITATVRQI